MLLEHDCVIVPGLGGFVGNYQPAKIHPTSFIFNSPSKSIAFNVNLRQNDGLLINSIATAESIAATRAEEEIRHFVAQIEEALGDHKPVKLPGIGRLTVDVENNLRFIPDNSQNYLPAAYGLYSFVAQPVVREAELPVPEKEPARIRTAPKRKSERKKRSFSDVFLPVAAVLLLILITVQIYIQSTIEGYDYAEILGLDKLFQKEELVLDKYKPTEVIVNQELMNYRDVDTVQLIPPALAPDNITPTVDNNLLIQPPSDRQYLLIAGSLKTVAAAQKIADRLREKNYSAFVLERGRYQMVAIAVPDSLTPSNFRDLFIEDTGIDDAWVTRNK